MVISDNLGVAGQIRGAPLRYDLIGVVSTQGGGDTPTHTTMVPDTFIGSDGTMLTAHAPETGGAWLLQPGTTETADKEGQRSAGRAYAARKRKY